MSGRHSPGCTGATSFFRNRTYIRFNHLDSSLTNENAETFNFGYLNGVRGFFTNPSRADDSFIPFSSGGKYIYATYPTQQVDFGFTPKYLALILHGTGYYNIWDIENDTSISEYHCPHKSDATDVSSNNMFVFNNNKTGLEKLYYYSSGWNWDICVF